MRQLKALWILLGVVVVLSGAYLVVHLVQTDQQDQQEKLEAVVSLLKYDGDTTQKIQISNEDGEFEFSYIDDTWTMTSENPFATNTNALSLICSYMADISSTKTITHHADRLAAYGLDQPVSITTFTSDNLEHTILIGDATPTYDAYYAKLPDSDTIYTISYTYGSVLCASKDTLRSTGIVENTYASDVTEFGLERDGKRIYLVNRTGSNWEMSEPLNIAAYPTKITSILDLFVRLTIGSFVEENPSDLSKYGLDQPGYVFTVGTADKHYEIRIGDPISADVNELYVYAMNVGTKQVFTIEQSAIESVQSDTVDMIYPYILNPEITEITSVQVDGLDIHSKLSVDYNNNQFDLDGMDLDAMGDTVIAACQNYYHGIATTSLSGLDLDANPEYTTPDISIVYSLTDGSTLRLDLIRQTEDSSKYWVFINGEYTKLITRTKFLTRPGSLEATYFSLVDKIASVQKAKQ